jgi:uncharacterized membrane protein YphA (DoxX/SURF4 family)
MPTLFVIGRVAFVLIFILSGAQSLMDVDAAAALISSKVQLAPPVADLAQRAAEATGKSVPELMAIAAGAVEAGAGIMVALGVGTRFAAFLLIVFTIAATYYFHDFWNMTGDVRTDNTIHAMKNLSMIGGLLVFYVLGSWRPIPMPADDPDSPAQMRY